MTAEALVRPGSSMQRRSGGASARGGGAASPLPSAAPRGRGSFDGKSPTYSLDQARPPSRSRPGRPHHHRKQAPPTEFSLSVARTVDVLRGDVGTDACQDMRRLLTKIRKEYDDVHCEADRREEELMKVRREIRLLDAESSSTPSENMSFASISHGDLQRRLGEVATEYDTASETTCVYQHMVSRLRRELHIVQQKVTVMQAHLRRKTQEVEKRQDLSRRVHQDKVAKIERLEDMEQDIETERQMCTAALGDLEETARLKRSEVNHREEFERWRYEVALEAANQAFQATAGRYRKIYAIEKLCGNCLQKHTFEQAEQSQATEDGFQKIREVTGLTDVMDIVTKFLHRGEEEQQLRDTVREAENRLHGLREAEAARHGEGACFDHLDELPVGRGLIAEVAVQEQQALKADHDLEQLQVKIKKDELLMQSILSWGERMTRSMALVEELPRLECTPDVVPFFESLAAATDRFLDRAHNEKNDQQLAKVATQAATKEMQEHMKLLGDREFLNRNLRVPATLDRGAQADDKKKGGGQKQDDGELGEQEHELERDRVKDDCTRKLFERAPHKMPKAERVREARRRDRTEVADGRSPGQQQSPQRASQPVASGEGQAAETTLARQSVAAAAGEAQVHAEPRPRSRTAGVRVTADKGHHPASRIKQAGLARPPSSAR